MNDPALHYQTIGQLAQRIRSGELSPVALTETLLARIQMLNPALNAFRMITEERALACAQAAEAQIKAGYYLGPLHGIPYVTKDLYDVAGLPTTAGSKTLENNIATDDATVTRKLAQAGITRGCNPPTNDRFCPTDFVTRGQMAAFLRRADAILNP